MDDIERLEAPNLKPYSISVVQLTPELSALPREVALAQGRHFDSLPIRAVGHPVPRPEHSTDFTQSPLDKFDKYTEDAANCVCFTLAGVSPLQTPISQIFHLSPAILTNPTFKQRFSESLSAFNKTALESDRFAMLVGGKYLPSFGELDFKESYTNMVHLINNLVTEKIGLEVWGCHQKQRTILPMFISVH